MKLLSLLALLPSLALATNTGQPSGGGHHGGYQGGQRPVQIINDVNGGRGGNGYGGSIAPGAVQNRVEATIAPGAVQNRVDAKAVGTGTGYGGNSSLVIEGAPANQTIRYINTPGLGLQYTPPSSQCYPSWSAGAVAPEVGAQATFPVRCAYHAHWMELANSYTAIGVAAVNTGLVSTDSIPANAAQVAAGQAAILTSLDLLAGTDINLYLLRKAQGNAPRIRPDLDIRDNLLGGMTQLHVEPSPDYVAPRPVVYHAPAYVPPSPPDKALDNYFQNEMKK